MVFRPCIHVCAYASLVNVSVAVRAVTPLECITQEYTFLKCVSCHTHVQMTSWRSRPIKIHACTYKQIGIAKYLSLIHI